MPERRPLFPNWVTVRPGGTAADLEGRHRVRGGFSGEGWGLTAVAMVGPASLSGDTRRTGDGRTS